MMSVASASRGALALVSLFALGLASCGDGVQGAGGQGGAATTSSATGKTSTGASPTTGSTSATSTSTSSTVSTGSGMPVGCLTDVSAGHHTVMCDGGITYDVEIPPACEQGPCGLVVDIHGYTMTGPSEDKNTGMQALGTQHGYVVVQPTAPKDALQQPSWTQPTHAPLVYTFVHDLAQSLPIDPKRIHAMGFSQGGGMTFRLMCTHAETFASIAPGGALPGCEFTGTNVPSEEVDILQMHGRVDGVVNFMAQAIPQRDAVLNGGWPFGAPTTLVDDGKHKATRYTTTSGTVFEFWEHDYQTSAVVAFVPLKGHCVPGGTDFNGFPAGYSCQDMNTFAFGQIAMQFFIDHPKP